MGLPLLVAALYLAGMTGSVLLIIAAFRVSKRWGFCVMCIPFCSFIFRLKHPEEVGPSFRISRFCYVACFALMGANPQTFGAPGDRFASITTALHLYTPARTPHTARVEEAEKDDGADDDEGTSSATAQPATVAANSDSAALEYREHVAELNATYEQLKAERATLKSAGPAMTAFNAKAAKYQEDLRKLAEEKARLDASLPATAANANTGGYTQALAQSISSQTSGSKTAHR